MNNVLSDESLYKKIVKEFREALSSMSELHAEFRTYDDYYNAKQWNKERASWRPDPVINYVAYIVDQKAPQLTNARPTGLILPTTSQDDETAKLFTQVTDVIADKVDLDTKIDEVVRCGLLFGTGFFKVYWDNNKSGGNFDKKNLWKGDICIDVPDVSNIYPDPGANCVEDCRYIIYAIPRTTKWVKETFNVEMVSDAAFETDIYDRPSNNHSKDRVMFYEYWHKENGKVNCVYAAGGKVLKKIEDVYKHGRYPFVAFTPKKARKTLWGIAEPKNIINNQKLLNKMVEIPATNALMTGNPPVLVGVGSGIDPNKWTNKPGQIYPVKDIGNAAKFLEPPQVSNDIPKLTQDLITYIEKISGVYDAATGNTPSSVTAATAIQLLQEQASVPIKGIARNLYASVKEVYEQMIELIKEFYTEERLIRITDDENGGFQFINFRGSDYAEIDLDVKVSAGASTPTSKAYIAQLSSELLDRGLLLPSEYLEMQENVPNKDRIIARLREQEAAQQAQTAQPQQPQTAPPPQMMPPEQVPMEAQMPPMAPPMQPQPPPISLQEIYDRAPDEIKQQIELLLEQGLPEEQVIQALMQMA